MVKVQYTKIIKQISNGIIDNIMDTPHGQGTIYNTINPSTDKSTIIPKSKVYFKFMNAYIRMYVCTLN